MSGNKTIFEEAEKIINKGNINFYFEKMDWSTRIWIKTICKVVEKRLKNLEDLHGQKGSSKH